ncbi:hypothetical protein EB796_005621 [Bugula neritina]|uniref:Uncharacterized protein n=1 Tax=Bugula neritina TaxID=10212 RepID=A0A7J7KBQ4_BUGNE|nr:hypothetical protein EB796_005621 [Bugula neritina]
MLTGEYVSTVNIGFRKPVYQAVVLSQAFKDIECDYPHQVANIELFSQERYSQLVADGHFDDSFMANTAPQPEKKV